MKNFIKTTLLPGISAVVFAFLVASPVLTLASPVTSSVAAGCEDRVLGIPPWYRGLTNGVENDCAIKSIDDNGGLTSFIWKVVFNVIEMALVVVVYIAVFFIMYGGFLWLSGGSRPDMVAKGRKAILNAAIGLIIAMSAIVLVNLIFNIQG